MEAQAKLAKLPVNSNPVRHSTRCHNVEDHMRFIENLTFVVFV